MPRTHGYSPVGKRCHDTHAWQAKGRINAIGAIINFVFVTVSLFEGSINSDTFYAWLTQDLLPKLPDRVVIVMDNASFHKRADMLEAIDQTSYTLEFLPPYSPDLNPIERKWAQAKATRRKRRCDVDTLFRDYFPYVNL
jgi:transposase